MSSAAGRWGFADAALELIRPGHGDTQSADVAQDAPDRLGAPLGADHFVQFYEDDSDLSRVVAIFLGDGIRAGDSLVVIATQAHERLFRQQLASLGLDPAQVQFFDAHDTLSKILRDGQPDREAFERYVGSLIGNLCAGLSGERSLRAYGEMVDVLWQGGRREEAIRLEELWNDLQERHSFVLLCAYALVSFDNEPANHHRVCAAHTHVVSDRPSHIESTAAPCLHARRLASEIARREEIEKTLRDSLRTLRTREEELRAREQELRKSEEQLRDFVENAPLGLHRVGPDGTILWANQAELDLLGYAANEYVGRNIAAFHADADVIEDILVRLRGGEVLHNRETRMRAKDGSLRYVLLSSNACVQDGEFMYTRCFTRDITERRQAEQALRESERLLRLVTDALPVLVAFVDAQGRYRFVSAMYERWFGRSRETIVGKSVAEVVGETAYRSEERRVGKECRSRWSPYH